MQAKRKNNNKLEALMMNTKELKEIISEDLYEITGGQVGKDDNFVETINQIYIKIKEHFNS